MPRTPAGGRLPHGPRHVLVTRRPVLALAVLAGLAACAAPPGPMPSVARTAPGAARATSAQPASSRATPGAGGSTPPAPDALVAPTPSATPTRSTTGPVRRVRGTVVRVSVESDTSHALPGSGDGGSGGSGGSGRSGHPGEDREAAVATWLQTPTGRVRVRTSTITDAPTGSTVDADVSPPGPTPSLPRSAVAAAESGATVVAARVTAAAPEPVLRAAVHDVTVVLAAPAGTTPDATSPADAGRHGRRPGLPVLVAQSGGRVTVAGDAGRGLAPAAQPAATTSGAVERGRASAPASARAATGTCSSYVPQAATGLLRRARHGRRLERRRRLRLRPRHPDRPRSRTSSGTTSGSATPTGCSATGRRRRLDRQPWTAWLRPDGLPRLVRRHGHQLGPPRHPEHRPRLAARPARPPPRSRP